MLAIRADQVNVLAQAQDRAFVDQLAASMQVAFAGALDPGDILTLTWKSARQAHALGLVTEPDTRRFVALAMAFGEGFEEHPGNAWARRIQRQEGAPAQRMEKAYRAAVAMTDAATATSLRRACAADGDSPQRMSRGDTMVRCTQRTWVEVQLLGMSGKPIPYERYRITLPNGELVEGYLDEDGVGGADMIDAGRCHVSFPDLDNAAVFVAGTPGPAV